MKVIKKINNNVILVDDYGVEKIVMGKGISFEAEVGGLFNGQRVDKLFVLDSKEKIRLFREMTEQIPMEYIDFAEEIILFIISEIKTPLDTNIYIALTDHIYFAIQRQREDSQVTAIMLPEMKLFYPEEYQVATEVVDKINQRYQTQLGNNEVGFITMHIINAELGERNSLNSLKILEITAFVIQLVEDVYEVDLDETSLAYNRMLIHIKFLVKRLIYQETLPAEELSFVKDIFRESTHYQGAMRITQELKKNYELDIGDNEVIYLAIHLARL